METIKALQKEHKNAHFMLVDGISKLTIHKVLTCQSSVFDVSGLKWKLIIYPAGNDGTKDYLSFYVRMKDRESFDSDWNVTCDLKLSIISQTRPDKWISSELIGVCYEEDQVLNGKEYFMSTEVLGRLKKGYLVNDQVVFCAEITNVDPSFDVTVVPRRTMGTAERLRVTEVARNNSKFTWKITRFSSFDSDKRHMSYEFTTGPRRWSISMYPNGINEEQGKALSLFLNAADYITSGPKAKTLAVFKLRVLDQLHGKLIQTEKMTRWFGYDLDDITNNSWGETEVMPLEKLKDSSWGYLVNDLIYIGVEFLLVSTTESL